MDLTMMIDLSILPGDEQLPRLACQAHPHPILETKVVEINQSQIELALKTFNRSEFTLFNFGRQKL